MGENFGAPGKLMKKAATCFFPFVSKISNQHMAEMRQICDDGIIVTVASVPSFINNGINMNPGFC